MIDQGGWHFAAAVSGETLQHALLRERIMFRLQIALRDRGPGCQIVERIASSVRVGRPEEQLIVVTSLANGARWRPRSSSVVLSTVSSNGNKDWLITRPSARTLLSSSSWVSS